MSKINQAVVNKYFNKGKAVTKTIMIDDETLEIVLQTRFTKQMEEKTIESIKSLSELFEQDEMNTEEVNYIMLTTTILEVLTDVEVPKTKDELVLFLGDFVSSGLGDEVFQLLDENCEHAVVQLNKFVINLAKAVEKLGDKTEKDKDPS